MAAILIVEDDEKYCDSLSGIVRGMGHEVVCADSLTRGLRALSSRTFDILFLEVQMPDGNGLDVLSEILAHPFPPEVIIITDFRTPEDAKVAIEKGAWCYMKKEFSKNEITLLIINILEYRKKKTGDHAGTPVAHANFEGIVGSSPSIKFCKYLVASVAKTDSNVFITGETGTGKELIASAIHAHSQRAQNNFVTVDCTALPAELVESILFGYEKGSFTGAEKSRDGLIKQAHGGTLFLDEVGELPLGVQSSFLRVIQEHSFRPVGYQKEIQSDFRLIVASNRDLEDMVRQGQFRDDLLFRIRSFTIEVPPLRKRSRDIRELAEYYTFKLCRQYGIEQKTFAPEFFHALDAYTWPGNVRELIHALENALIAAQQEPALFAKHLPTYIRIWLTRTSLGAVESADKAAAALEASGPLLKLKDVRSRALAHTEEKYLTNLMRVANSDIAAACRISGLSRTRLYVLLKKYRIATHF
ncbi:MAG: sigma-54-dependent Fis family transcriptional regulator [Deltaproteobacteria bacterium]|nr:sigma-54-dependent Fis family transcriptional regulator [Deltaproteobacteria bacterium]